MIRQRFLAHICLLVSVFSPVIAAQQSDSATLEASGEETVMEEVIVTGTRITRRDFNTPSPLTTVGEELIEFTGQTTLEDTLNLMPQVFPAFGRASNNPGNGTAQVDLRGLGAGRSLVLLNGRRMAPSGTGNAVNLNNIPRFLIERVEIITGGTSAVYGSDAIAGVVNFITRSDFTGLGLEAGYNVTEQGDAESFDFNFAWGRDLSSGAGNITVYANYLDREPLLAGEREFTRYPFFDDWEGNLVQGGSSRVPAGLVTYPPVDFGAGLAQTTFNEDGTPREFRWPEDAYNYALVNYLQIPLTRYALGTFGFHEVAEAFEAYFEASFIRNDTSQNLAAIPANMFVEVNLDNPVLASETAQLFTDNFTCDENLACFRFSRRLLEVGERIADLEQDYARLVAGIRGDFSDDWTMDAWLTWTSSDAVRYLYNDVSRSRFQQGLLVDPQTGQCYDPSGGCVPINVFGEGNISQEAADFLRFPPYENVTERTFWQASGFVSGSLVDTWAGPLDVAIGAEWRSDDTYFRADEALFDGDAMGWSGYAAAPVEGVERIWEIYGEALVPLLEGKKGAERLELELGARYTKSNYSEGYWTYKVGFAWEFFEGLTLRAMHQRSMRSPNSQEMFEEQGFTESYWVTNNWSDPCSAESDPVGNDVVDKCLIQGLPEDQIGVFEATPFYSVDFYWGGNPDLLPEEGKTWTAGFILEPEALSNWVFTVDYFRMEVTDTIGDIFADIICFDAGNTENVFCENLVRDETGNVAEIYEFTSNRGLLETSGVDTQIQYQSELPDWLALPGRYAYLNVNLYWTHLLSLKNQENPVSQIYECAGLFGWPCTNVSNPQDRVTTQFNYMSGPFEAQLTWRWISGMDNAVPLGAWLWGVEDPDLAITEVPDRHYLDLGFAYTFRERYQLRGGVTNLLDTDPVMMADQAWSNNTDENLYDVFGRSYYLRFSARF